MGGTHTPSGGWPARLGVPVGHATVGDAPTGCTVVLLPRACAYGVLATGGAASTRQVSALHASPSITVADAFLVTGGSAYGLDATGGVLRWLEARGRGTAVGPMRVPSVPSATLFDLFVAPPGVRPGVATGEAACEAARPDAVTEGRAGAGAGASVGKILGIAGAMRGGVGAAHVELPGGLLVAALAFVNAFGNVHDPATGRCVAGARDGAGGFFDAEAAILEGALLQRFREAQNTTIGIVVTNGALSAAGCGRAAALASQAFPLCIRPCQTAVDGDTAFVASAGDVEAEPHQVGLAGRDALARAVVRAVEAANLS